MYVKILWWLTSATALIFVIRATLSHLSGRSKTEGKILLVGCGQESCARLRSLATLAGYDAYQEMAYTFSTVRDLILSKRPRLILSDLFLLNPTLGPELAPLCKFLGVQIIVVLVDARVVRPEIVAICDEIFTNARLFHNEQGEDIVRAIREIMGPGRACL
jgi:hypothetical protein